MNIHGALGVGDLTVKSCRLFAASVSEQSAGDQPNAYPKSGPAHSEAPLWHYGATTTRMFIPS
jgi:hypothetical protein